MERTFWNRLKLESGRARSAFLYLLAGSVLTLGGCAVVARKTVLPGPYLQPPENRIAPGADYTLVPLELRDGTKIVAQYGPAFDRDGHALSTEKAASTVIFFYGNRMCIAASQGIFGDLRRMGVNVLIPEYPGYGVSEGKASEAHCYAAADAAYEYLAAVEKVEPSRIYIAGISLGAGVAVELATKKNSAGLVLVVPFASVRAVGKDSLPWYLRWAVPMIAHYAAFDNVARIAEVHCPILLVQATADQITPARRTDALMAAAKEKIERVVINADHDGSWLKGREAVAEWLQRQAEAQR